MSGASALPTPVWPVPALSHSTSGAVRSGACCAGLDGEIRDLVGEFPLVRGAQRWLVSPASGVPPRSWARVPSAVRGPCRARCTPPLAGLVFRAALMVVLPFSVTAACLLPRR